MDVIDAKLKMLFASNVTIKVIGLPKSTHVSNPTIDAMGSVGFPRMDYPTHGVTLEGVDHGMNVIRHDNPGQESISLHIEVKKGFLDDKRDVKIL